MQLNDIRKAYEKNYHEMSELIARMGGDDQIKFHRKNRTPLYRKLKELQRREHYLDEMENRLRANTIH